VGPFLATCVAVAGLSFANGGYFPTEWGAAILGFVLVGVALLALVDVPQPGRLECAFVAGLASLAAWMALSSLWSPGAAAPVLEAERAVLYVAVAAAAVLVLAAGADP
jgi:hypothetical protein